MVKKLSLMLTVLIGLSGCAEMNSKFDCQMKPGVSCASLDQVNAKVDRGEIGGEELTYHPTIKKISSYQTEISKPPYHSRLQVRKPLRYGESTMRVWVAPFEDTSGNYHQESDIYTIVKPGHWIGYPVKATHGDEE